MAISLGIYPYGKLKNVPNIARAKLLRWAHQSWPKPIHVLWEISSAKSREKMGGWPVFFSQPTNGNSVQIQTYGTHALKSLFCLTYPLLSQNYCRIYQRTHNPKLPKLEIVIIHLSFHQWTFRALEAAILSLVILQNHAYTSYFVKQGRFRTTKNYWWKVPTWKIIRSHWRMDHPPLESPWWNLSMTNRLYDVIWLQ